MEPIILTISGGVSHQSEITLFKAGQILALISSPENQSAQPAKEISDVKAILSNHVKRSLIEVMREAKANTLPQKIIVAADYIMGKNVSETFNINDIRSEFKKIGLTPANFSRDFRTTISQGWVYESEHSGEYLLTETASEIISQGFDSVDQPQKTKRIARKKSTSKRKGVSSSPIVVIRPEVENLPISSEPEGMVNYHDKNKLAIKSDKLLWILVYADSNSVPGLSGKEISFLSEKIKGKILEKDVSSFASKHIKNSSVIKDSSGLYKVQQKGIDSIRDMKNA